MRRDQRGTTAASAIRISQMFPQTPLLSVYMISHLTVSHSVYFFSISQIQSLSTSHFCLCFSLSPMRISFRSTEPCTEAQRGSCTYPDRSLLSGSSHGSSFTFSVTLLSAVAPHSLASSFVSFSSSSAWLSSSSSSFTLLISALSSHGAVVSVFSS